MQLVSQRCSVSYLRPPFPSNFAKRTTSPYYPARQSEFIQYLVFLVMQSGYSIFRTRPEIIIHVYISTCCSVYVHVGNARRKILFNKDTNHNTVSRRNIDILTSQYRLTHCSWITILTHWQLSGFRARHGVTGPCLPSKGHWNVF